MSGKISGLALILLGCGRIGFEPLPLQEVAQTAQVDGSVPKAVEAGSPDSSGQPPQDGGLAPQHDASTVAVSDSAVPSKGDASASDAGLKDAGTFDAGDPLRSKGDDFNSPLDSKWTVLNPDLLAATTSAGNLLLNPLDVGQWFGPDHGGAVVTEVSGDFIVTASIAVFGSGGTPPAGPGLETGGIIALDPSNANGENHVWASFGADSGSPTKESKSTIAGTSTYTIDPYVESKGIVRICRIGSTFRTYHAPFDGSGPWTPHEVYDRPDLPSVLNVGPFSTEQSTPIDIQVVVAWITFRRPASVADCTN